MPNTIPLLDWLEVMESEYLSTFIPNGGASVKFAVTSDQLKVDLHAALRERCEKLGILLVSLDAASQRAHMPQDLFHGLASSVNWREAARRMVLKLARERVYIVDGQRSVAGSGPSGPGQQLTAHPVQLADVAPPEAAQEGSQGGRRLDHAANGASRPSGAQHIGVVNAVATGQRRGHQGHYLVPRVRPPRRSPQVNVLADEFPQTQALGEGDRKDQPGIGHQAVVVEGDSDAVGVAEW